MGWAATKSWLSGRAMKPSASAPARRQQYDGSNGALRSQSIERLSGSTAPQLERSYSDVIQLVSGSFHMSTSVPRIEHTRWVTERRVVSGRMTWTAHRAHALTTDDTESVGRHTLDERAKAQMSGLDRVPPAE